VGYLTQLFQRNQIPLDNILSLITSKDHPLSFFGRNIKWMTPGLISRIVFKYIKTGIFDTSLIPKRDRFYSSVNSLTIKNILLNRIINLINKIESIDEKVNRINILDCILTSDQLESYYGYRVDNNQSLDLQQDITKRSY
jgi:hypothetical protein